MEQVSNRLPDIVVDALSRLYGSDRIRSPELSEILSNWLGARIIVCYRGEITADEAHSKVIAVVPNSGISIHGLNRALGINTPMCANLYRPADDFEATPGARPMLGTTVGMYPWRIDHIPNPKVPAISLLCGLSPDADLRSDWQRITQLEDNHLEMYPSGSSIKQYILLDLASRAIQRIHPSDYLNFSPSAEWEQMRDSDAFVFGTMQQLATQVDEQEAECITTAIDNVKKARVISSILSPSQRIRTTLATDAADRGLPEPTREECLIAGYELPLRMMQTAGQCSTFHDLNGLISEAVNDRFSNHEFMNLFLRIEKEWRPAQAPIFREIQGLLGNDAAMSPHARRLAELTLQAARSFCPKLVA